MLRYSSLKFIFIYFYASAAVLSTITAETTECGVINTKQFLNNERVTEIDEFPWMTRVAFNMSPSPETYFPCQAVLISQRHLLAIASCIDRKNGYDYPYAVLLGAWNTSNDFAKTDCDGITGKCSTPKLIEIEEIIIHPLHHSLRRENDIALLRLTEPIAFSDYIRPICLPGKEITNKEFGSEELKLTGWPLPHRLTRKISPGPKQKMSTFIYNQHDCRRKFSNVANFKITDSNLCGIAGDIEADFLSGAALMDVKDIESPQAYGNAYLVGLLAYGLNSIFGRDQQVLIRIDQYLDWIEKNVY